MKSRLVVPEDLEEVRRKYFADPARFQSVKEGEMQEDKKLWRSA